MAQKCRDKVGFKFQCLTSLITGWLLGPQNRSQVSRAPGYIPPRLPTRLPALGELHSNGNAVLQLVGTVPKAHFSVPLSPQWGWAQLMCTCDTLAASLGWHSTAPQLPIHTENLPGGISKQHIPAARSSSREAPCCPAGGHPARLAGDTGDPHTPGSPPLFPAHSAANPAQRGISSERQKIDG